MKTVSEEINVVREIIRFLVSFLCHKKLLIEKNVKNPCNIFKIRRNFGSMLYDIQVNNKENTENTDAKFRRISQEFTT